MRVVVVEDNGLFRRGLILQLDAAGVDVVAECRDGRELDARLDALDREDSSVDVVVTDIRMPPTHTNEGIALARRLRVSRPALGLLVLSAHADTSSAVELMEGTDGRVGYLLKDNVDDVGVLRDALDRVAAGGTVMDGDLVASLFRRDANRRRLERLSPRERDVLALVAEGLSNTAIAGRVHLSPKTIESNISTIFERLELPAGTGSNRRVLATVEYLRLTGLGPAADPSP